VKYFQYLALALAAYASGSASFRVGPMSVTVTLTGGQPVHLTLAAVFLVAEKVLSGEQGTFTSGVVAVTLAPYVAPAPV
jgi:hypothetical protein